VVKNISARVAEHSQILDVVKNNSARAAGRSRILDAVKNISARAAERSRILDALKNISAQAAERSRILDAVVKNISARAAQHSQILDVVKNNSGRAAEPSEPLDAMASDSASEENARLRDAEGLVALILYFTEEAMRLGLREVAWNLHQSIRLVVSHFKLDVAVFKPERARILDTIKKYSASEVSVQVRTALSGPNAELKVWTNGWQPPIGFEKDVEALAACLSYLEDESVRLGLPEALIKYWQEATEELMKSIVAPLVSAQVDYHRH
jgi:hypothetical protein